ncbi:GHKL domain-containing protein [Thermoactinomyces daqus]|uniref:histidine kinase n=1 Tax=Thermoactinomyces daqus TaxID=1329516 RepID=A0A7W1XCX7_9BACL|nr:ATP-binding protein [Thermoactinomyces daqus]MBA4544252.1 GHKL domain-containing protein [Thermoactinomyces daqus]
MINMNIKQIAGNEDHQSCHLYTFYPVTPFERLAAQLFGHIHLGVVLLDDGLNVMEMNLAASELLSCDRAKVLYRSFQEVITRSEISHRQRERLLSMLLAKGDEPRQAEVEWNGNEEIRYLFLRIQGFDDGESGLKGKMVVIEDVTEKRSLSLQVRRNNRLATVGQIAAGTAHEIRNPLTAIKGFLQVIGHKLKENGQQKEHGYIDIMLKEISRISNLVGEFLMLSKPRPTDLRAISVSKVLKEILPIIKNEALLHNVDVVIERRLSSIPLVIADGEMLKQVFLNLCKNAIEAMNKGGRLTISMYTDEAEQTMAVEIADEGPGIPGHILEKVFQPFFTTKENGTGLGLPICRQILHEIGGEIEVDSDEQGTVAKVTLPLVSSRVYADS